MTSTCGSQRKSTLTNNEQYPLPLWTWTLPNFGFFMFSGFSDIASSNEIKRKSTFTNNRPYTWAAEMPSKIEKKPVFKNTRKKACDFYEQGFLLRWFSTRNKESPSCRKMFGESYVAPTRRSQNFFSKKSSSWKINKVWQEPHEQMLCKCWKITS